MKIATKKKSEGGCGGGGSGWGGGGGGGGPVRGVQVYVYEELKLLRKCKKKVGREGVPIGSKVGGSG